MTETAIDVAALKKLKDMIGGNVEDLSELVDDFLTSLPEQLSQMRAAEQSEDWAALRITSHSCKSNARDLGANHLSELCAELERQCKAGAPVDLGAQLSAIETAAEAAMAGLKDQDLVNV